MKAADVFRVIDHAISTEIGLPADRCQTGEEYRVYCVKDSLVTDSASDVEDETLLGHALTAEMLHDIRANREPGARLFWRTTPTFVARTPETPAAMRAVAIITAKPKLYARATDLPGLEAKAKRNTRVL